MSWPWIAWGHGPGGGSRDPPEPLLPGYGPDRAVKNYGNRLTVDKVMAKINRLTFLAYPVIGVGVEVCARLNWQFSVRFQRTLNHCHRIISYRSTIV